MTTKPGLLTADDLLRLDSQGMKGELIRGVLHETVSAGGEHGEIVGALITAIRPYVRSRRLGRVGGSDSGILLERNPDTVREPDIAFTSAERLPLDAWNAGYSEVVPDLVVEVASPSDSRRELNDKAQMWLRYGVRLVWVVHPGTRAVDVHRADGGAVTIAEDGSLDGLDVLPGFACAVSAIFDA